MPNGTIVWLERVRRHSDHDYTEQLPEAGEREGEDGRRRIGRARHGDT